MQPVGTGLQWLAGLGALICFILVVVKLFQTGQTGLGIACIVLFFCCGIGLLFGLIVGWINARRWNSQNLMIIYTVCYVLQWVGIGLAPPDFAAIQQQFQAR